MAAQNESENQTSSVPNLEEETTVITLDSEQETPDGSEIIILSAPTVVYSKDQADPSALPGQCGLYNLGNTCFMNAGLHCLLNTTPLLKYIGDQLKAELVLGCTLASNFYLLSSKYWSGQFSIIYPNDFKATLGNFHSQFQDYRQHDCQEFLALMLDTLHEETYQCQQNLNFCNDGDVKDDACVGCDQLNNSTENAVADTDLKSDSTNLNNSTSLEAPALSSSDHLNNSFDQDSSVARSLSVDQLNNSIDSKRSTDSTEFSSVVTQSADTNETADSRSASEKCSSELPTLNSSGSCEQENDSGDPTINKVQHILSPLEPILNNATNFKQTLPSLTEFYLKESKTLNTNVLINSGSSNLNVDSQKFAKQDNDSPMRLHEFNLLQDQGMMEVDKGINDHPKGIKDVNIQADKCNKESISVCFEKDLPEKCNNLAMHAYFDPETDSVKRMKFETTEKNLQHQAFSKLNRNIAITTSGSAEFCEKETVPDSPVSARETEGRQEEDTNSILALSESVGAQQLEEDEEEEEDEDEEDEGLLEAAEVAWESYVKNNSSIIVSTFQGMFKSMVICSECSNISVTFEPFMYLSVPLPYSMERQICVWFMPCQGQPTKYLLTLNKNDKIYTLKHQMRAISSCGKDELCAAEVLDGHISKVLDDQHPLRFLNSTSRSIYVFQMMPPPDCGAEPLTTESQPNNSSAPITQTVDIFSDMDTYIPNELSDSQKTDLFQVSPDQEEKMDTSMELRTDLTLTDESPFDTGTSYALWGLEQDGSSVKSEWNNASCNLGNNAVEEVNSATDNAVPLTADYQDVTTTLTTDQWRSCAICLEELTDVELMAHQQCGGTFCQTCLEMSIRHYGEDSYTCPVCSAPAVLTEDFISLGNDTVDQAVKVRIVAFHIAFCLDNATTGERHLIGHPRILYLPNQIAGQLLYEALDKVIPVFSHYSVILTDGQGLHCSRCDYSSKCQGCLVMRDGDMALRPGDTLTVCYTDLSTEELEQAKVFHVDKSMEQLRPDKPLQLYDCIQAFTDTEILDEHNPWYCPRCERNQCARKTMTVWQYPDRLIIHLKRFCYHDQSSNKIDSSVVFPVEGLDLTQIISGPDTKGLMYNLYGIVCHFGGVNSGHYTAYCKNPLNQRWMYYNDETVIEQEPQTADFSNAYILFYQRQGMETTFDIANFINKYKGELSGPTETKSNCLASKDSDGLCKSLSKQDVSGDVAVAS